VKIKATFAKDGKWWVAWTEDVPGAMTQGRTLQEARRNLVNAIQEMLKPIDASRLPSKKIIVEELEV
jgi:predicted RNase H-like HicB family nuclease